MKNTRILLLAMAGLMISHMALSQAKVALGIKGGLNFANVNASSVGAAYNSRTGYHVGAFAMFKLTKIAIQPELIYSSQGTDVTITGVPGSFNSNFDYLNIPVLLKFYLAGGFNLQAGPQFGFLMSAQGPVVNGSTGTVTTGNIKDDLESSDVSIGVGVGFDLPARLNIDARYNIGVSDVNNGASTSAIKNQVFQLSLGFKLINFGK
jgi:hypothetical protein